MILGVAMPAVLLLLFSSIGKNAPLGAFTADELTPGVIVLSFGFLTMFSAMLLAKDRQSAFLTRLLIAPLKSTDFILAYMLPFLPIAILQTTVCFAIGIILGITPNLSIALALVVLLTIAVACIGIGMILGSFLTENQVAGAGSLVIISISLFGGAWMDLKMLGGIFEAVGYALPFAHAIDAARAILKGSGLGEVTTELYWIIGYALVFFLLGIFSFSWRTKHSR
jgi:ABC-2 type transport system permease protein